ncbi:hypothetical protein ACLI4Z_01400 [Natrialbaceae archaeon A-arb3/5]
MNTDTTNVETPGSDAHLPADVVFDLLLDGRRRYALYYLSRKVGAVDVDELVDRIAERDGTETADHRDAIRLEFCHNHLRRLVDAGVLRYDRASETVERTAMARVFDPYLELAFVQDLSR